MTVQELFDHFHNWFDRITYQVSPAKTGEFGDIKVKDNYEKDENQRFLHRFGDCIVEEREFLTYDNAIYLLIKDADHKSRSL